ncbi:MAG: bifunctional riboflavin kinase/FAD synthetase [Pseudomonadaceae bacterium]|nr:bifunctional riboflavin kinase/FAD synthetase [Pseudomonadaceae bacterium]
MKVIRGYHNLTAAHRGCVATFGTFDGVHHGHQVLIAHVRAKAAELGVPSMLITLEPQPREFFADPSVPVPARLTRFREKSLLLCQSGLDYLLCLPFNRDMADTTAEEVIDRLIVDRLALRYLVIGDDFRFGQRAAGDYAMLKRAGEAHGFEVSKLGTLAFDDDRVSSTRVRQALADADFALAEKLLGRAYSISGRVVYGRQLGRQLGVPTANIRLQRYRAALQGVYAVRVSGVAGEDVPVPGVANIGVRPTVDGEQPMLEVHLFDYSGDLYGQRLSVTFHHKIRDEQTFDGLEALKTQIHADMDSARALLNVAARNGREPSDG